ncbi:histamine H2 receptor-like [Dendronephthya gigantea]|uniref:histamine H2 receptor-like n=1 Tax=Dendronephthya gigantea TaxID=151771 RepID=UPI00106C9566|nr:histamine H2 receptor-like [Dendronephthya gigantea]XP_028398387.1 histamine H2 receptor-like [Dendronephthya gigantea]
MAMGEWDRFHYGYVTISVVAILLNTTVIYLFLTKKYLRNMHSNTFLFSLAISDFCYASVAIPLLIRCEQFFKYSVCYAYEYIMVFFGYSTVYHILLAITEKLCAICFPLKHHSMFCKSIAIKSSLSVWLFSIALSHIPIWWDYIFPGSPKENMQRDEIFYKFHFATGFALPMLMSIMMYSIILHKIFKVANARLSEDTQSSKLRLHVEKKAACTFAIMLGAFLFSWITWFIARIYDPILNNVDIAHFFTISRFLDPIFNPILYTFLKNDFRRAFLSLWRSKKQNNELLQMRLTRHHCQGTGTAYTHEDLITASPRSLKRKPFTR